MYRSKDIFYDISLIFRKIIEQLQTDEIDSWNNWLIVDSFPTFEIYNEATKGIIYVDEIRKDLKYTCQVGGNQKDKLIIKVGCMTNSKNGGSYELQRMNSHLYNIVRNQEINFVSIDSITIGDTIYENKTAPELGVCFLQFIDSTPLFPLELDDFVNENEILLRT